jgi:hypothetical protein
MLGELIPYALTAGLGNGLPHSLSTIKMLRQVRSSRHELSS